METRRIIVITAVIAICVSAIMSAYFTRVRKQEMKKHGEDISRSTPDGYPFPPGPKVPPASQKKKATDNLKTKRGGWGAFMLPFYSFGILAYIVYVVAKIMTKKYSSIRKNNQIKVSWNKKPQSKGKSKTKITMHELQQLEQKLQETEAAVQQIFVQTCEAVKAADKTLRSSSDEEYSARPTKRLKKMAMKQSHSTDGEPYSEPEELSSAQKINPTHMKSGLHLRRRRVKRTSRKLQKDLMSTSSSNSEPEETISSKHRDSDKLLSSSEADILESDSYELNKEDEEIDDKDRGDLLQTAKDIRETMSELQSYIDDKRAALDSE